jgi:aerobic C4-dicarboxylate transport protein
VVLGAGSDRGGHRVRARIARHGREGASLQAFGGTFFTPEAIAVGIALVVGIDRIMSEGRALTNCIGNGVATMVVAKWQGERDDERFQAALRDPRIVEDATERALRGETVEEPRFGGRFERERREEVLLPG